MIRWGIWGTGSIANLVAKDLRLVDGSALHAVASRTPERAQRFAARHRAPRCYGGLEALLKDPEVDVIYVATPHHRHLEDCIACIQAEKAVLCEKPFALNLTQAQQIVNTARDRKIFCMEAMWMRFIPGVMEAKRAIDRGAIGRVRMIQGNFAYRVPEGRESRFFNPELGGGALLDRGVYLISLAQHLLGVPQTIRGSACVGATGVDEQSAYQLVFDSGAIADLSASLCVRGTNEVVISGDSGLLRLCEPFYCADRFTIQAHAHPRAAAQEDAQAEPTGLRKVTRAVRDASTTRLLRRRLSPIVSALRRGKARSFPFPGNGYQFELKHVNECLGEHRTESPIMPLNQSLEVMQTMDILRNQMGLNETSAAMRTV